MGRPQIKLCRTQAKIDNEANVVHSWQHDVVESSCCFYGNAFCASFVYEFLEFPHEFLEFPHEFLGLATPVEKAAKVKLKRILKNERPAAHTRWPCEASCDGPARPPHSTLPAIDLPFFGATLAQRALAECARQWRKKVAVGSR